MEVSPDFACTAMCLSNLGLQNILHSHISIWNRAMYVDKVSVVKMTEEEMLFYAKFTDLVLNCEYDYANYLNGTIPGTSYSAYGVLVKRTAVCQGYALAYKYLCNQVGIDCYMVTSTAMNHAWNMIVLGENLYQVDVTWDDPAWDRIGGVSHSYMFLSDEQLTARKHHDWEVTIGSDVVDLTATDTTYDNYFWGNASSQLVRDGGDYYYTDGNTMKLTKYTAADQSTAAVADLVYGLCRGVLDFRL